MSVAPISGTVSYVPTASQNDAGAHLQDVRKRLQDVTPPGQWNAVVAEVSRVQAATSSSVLEAYRAVLSKMATGWRPPPVAYPPAG